MSYQIDFLHELQYRDLGHGFFPVLDLTVIGPTNAVDLLAVIDTGAQYSLFNGARAALIGLDLTAGKRVILGGLAGRMIAWLHQVDLEILGARFRCEVAFSEQPIPRELLGRHTVFKQIRIAFREGTSCVYLDPSP